MIVSSLSTNRMAHIMQDAKTLNHLAAELTFDDIAKIVALKLVNINVSTNLTISQDPALSAGDRQTYLNANTSKSQLTEQCQILLEEQDLYEKVEHAINIAVDDHIKGATK